MTDKETNFLKLVTAPALISERDQKIAAPITIAQAALESGWGGSKLFTEANNPFGIKFSHIQGSEAYGELDFLTREDLDGHWVTVKAQFQKYPDLRAAFIRHGALLLGRRYARFLGDSMAYLNGDYASALLERCATALGPEPEGCGYSTNPRYADELMALIQEFHLDDRAVLKAFEAAPAVKAAAVPLGPEVMH